MKRLAKVFLGILVSVLLILSVLYFFRDTLLAPRLKNYLIYFIESEYDLKVDIGSLEGSYFTTLKINNFRTTRPNTEGPLVSLSFNQADLGFFLPDILIDREDFVKEMSVRIHQGDLKLNLSDSQERDEEEEDDSLLPLLPQISLYDSQVEVVSQKGEAVLNQLNADFNLPANGKAGQLNLTVENFLLDHEILRGQQFSLSAVLNFTENYLKVQKLLIDESWVVESALFEWGREDKPSLLVKAGLNIFGGQVSLTGRFSRPDLDLDFGIRNVQLRRLSTLLSPELPNFAGLIDSKGSISTSTTDFLGKLNGNLKFSAQESKLRQTTFEKVDLQAEAVSGTLRIEELVGKSGSNLLELKAREVSLPLLAEGYWRKLLRVAQANFNLATSDVPALLRIAGVEEEFGEIPGHHLTLQGDLRNKRVSAEGLLKTESAEVVVSQASLLLPPENEQLNQAQITAAFHAAIPELAEISSILGLASLQGQQVKADLDLTGKVASPQGEFALTANNLQYGNNPLGDLDIKAQADFQRVILDSFTLYRGENKIKASGSLDLKPLRISRANLEFTLTELADYAFFFPELAIQGRAEGMVTAAGAIDQPKVNLRVNLEDAEVKEIKVAEAHLDLINVGREAVIQTARAQIAGNELEIAGEVKWEPALRPLEVRLKTFIWASPGGGNLVLQEPAVISYLSRGIEIDNLKMAGSMGSLQAEGSLVRGIDSRLSLNLSDFSSKGWLYYWLGDRLKFQGLDADFLLKGSLSNPAISLKGEIQDLRGTLFPLPLSGEYNLDYSPEGIIVRTLEFYSGKDRRLSFEGKLPLDPLAEDIFLPGEIVFSGVAEISSLKNLQPFLPAKPDLEGSARGSINLTGNWQNPKAQLNFYGEDIEFYHPEFPSSPSPLDISTGLAIAGRQLTIKQLRINSQELNFNFAGVWEKGPALARILQGYPPEFEGNLSGQGRLVMTELDWLADSFEDLRRINGRLEADISLEGPMKNPNIMGELTVSGGEIRTTFDLPALENLQARIEFRKELIRLDQIKGEIGAAPFDLQGEIIRNKDNGLLFDLNLNGSDLLFYRSQWMKIRANTALNLKGPLSRSLLSGQVLITDAYYRKRFRFLDVLRGNGKPAVVEDGLSLFSFREQPLSDLVFRVDINSEDPITIDNNVIKTTIRPDLRLAGTGELPVLVGRIYVDPGKITLPAAGLNIRSGVVQFPENRPNNPVLSIAAETRMKGYDIEVIIEGTYREPLITLSSVPPLPRDDLLLLLLTGRQPTAGLGEELTRTAGTSIAFYFGRELLGRLFAGESEESFLERLQLEIGRSITRKGEETLEAQFRLGRDILITDDVSFLTAEKDIYDDYNIGLKIIFRFK